VKPDESTCLILEACKQIKKLALGWNERRLLARIVDTWRFARMNRELGNGATQRQRIPRLTPQEPPAISLDGVSIQHQPAPSSQGNRFWQRGHVYEPDMDDDLLFPQPGMSLDAFVAHAPKSGGR
jgi:hypothetical protein